MGKKIYSLLLRPFLAFIYILGLSFIIPFLLSTKLPEEIAVKYNSTSFLIISVILLSASIVMTFYLKENAGKSLKSLAYYSLIPGILSLVTAVFGKDLLVDFFFKYVKNEAISKTLEPTITAYINSKVTRLWFLTAAYIILGIILYYTGRKLR